VKFSRFEFKFSEERVVSSKFVKVLSPYLHLDPFSQNGSYRVDSIYFDCHALKDFRDKQNALLERGKFRLRSYGNITSQKVVFLEYKGKLGDFVVKDRIQLTRRMVDDILQGIPLVNVLEDRILEFSPKIIKELINRPTLKPLTIVSYDRSAYFYIHDDRVRITHDTHVVSGPFSPSYRRKDLNSMRGGRSVVELKFLNSLPAVFNQHIKHLGLSRVSNSKAEFSFTENNINWV